jgi:hypothetical protein
MRFLTLIMFFDFIQVLSSARKHYSKNEYFLMHILFFTIYLLEGQQLNHNKKPENEIIMRDFVQATEYDAHMYEKFQYLFLYRIFVQKHFKF